MFWGSLRLYLCLVKVVISIEMHYFLSLRFLPFCPLYTVGKMAVRWCPELLIHSSFLKKTHTLCYRKGKNKQTQQSFANLMCICFGRGVGAQFLLDPKLGGLVLPWMHEQTQPTRYLKVQLGITLYHSQIYMSSFYVQCFRGWLREGRFPQIQTYNNTVMVGEGKIISGPYR